jgi:hypothetical protein
LAKTPIRNTVADPIIGERQTVSRAKHPTLGEGRAVYRNGPAFFVADSGDVVAYQKIDMGRCGVSGSFLRARAADGEKVELEVTKRDSGKTHERVVTEDGRPGWLVWWFDEFGTWCNVFEPNDGGEPLKFGATYAHVGRPLHDARARQGFHVRLFA